MALESDRTAAQIRRDLSAETGADWGYQAVRRIVVATRAGQPMIGEDLNPASMALRILRLLEREIAALERKPGPADVDRLDRIARTLKTVQPLQLRSERRSASLRSLLNSREDLTGSASDSEADDVEPSMDESAVASQLR